MCRVFGEYPSGDGAVLIKRLPWVRFPPLRLGGRRPMDRHRSSKPDECGFDPHRPYLKII